MLKTNKTVIPARIIKRTMGISRISSREGNMVEAIEKKKDTRRIFISKVPAGKSS